MYIQVVFPSIDSYFTYETPATDDVYEPGIQVLVPFGRKEKIGYCAAIDVEKPIFPVKRIKKVFYPAIPRTVYTICEWISDYYRAPRGSAFQAAYPPFMRVKIAQMVQKGKYFHTAPSEIYDNWKKDAYTIPEVQTRFSLTPDDIIQFCQKEILQQSFLSTQKQSQRTQERVRLCVTEDVIDILPKNALIQRECLSRLCALQGDAPASEFLRERSALKSLEKKGYIEFYMYAIQNEDIVTPHNLHTMILSVEQQNVYNQISMMNPSDFSVHYVYGITGSGKTHVYFHLIRDIIEAGKQALYLVPEVALTHHLVERFTHVFGDTVQIMHSYMSDRERARAWNAIYSGERRVILGTRSAVFAPALTLGIIIVDEEHETSFKQDETPRYNGRDTAIMRAKLEKIPIILGSATPSAESFAHVQSGKYHGYTLHERYGSALLPTCSIVDMRDSRINRFETYPLSTTLVQAIKACLEKKEQVILFLNRKGFHTMLSCTRCDAPLVCSHCEVPLTYYKKAHAYKCHVCGMLYAPDETKCATCAHTSFKATGMGTERLLEKTCQIFPESTVVQIDTSIIRRHSALDEIMKRFEKKEIDILIGTQMIAKGLDFENVTLVGIIRADGMLNIPDFRANERAFQLISQVAGRAGRGEKQGAVIIQTYIPDHYVINAALTHDYDTFYAREILFRHTCQYPPFLHLIRCRFEHVRLDILVREMSQLQKALAPYKKTVTILGPEEDIVPKKNNKYQYAMLMKGSRNQLQALTDTLVKGIFKKMSTSVIIDVDPYSMF